MHAHTYTHKHTQHTHVHVRMHHMYTFQDLPEYAFFLNECHGYFWQYSHSPSQGLTTLSLVGVACVHDVFVHGNILVPVRMKSIE